MAMILVRPTPPQLSILSVHALYSDGEVEAELAGELAEFLNEHGEGAVGPRGHALVERLHRRLVDRGDLAEHREQFGSSPHGYYMASGELTLLSIEDRRVRYCQLGGIHAAATRGEGKARLLVPVHNVKEEQNRNTIEESCLAPFRQRRQEDIARQLLVLSPSMVPALVRLDRSPFDEAIGHVPTRVIGYFQDPGRTEVGRYHSATPVPETGSAQLNPGEKLLVWVPTAADVVPYDRSRALVRMLSLAAQADRLLPIGLHRLDPGSLIVAPVEPAAAAEMSVLVK